MNILEHQNGDDVQDVEVHHLNKISPAALDLHLFFPSHLPIPINLCLCPCALLSFHPSSNALFHVLSCSPPFSLPPWLLQPHVSWSLCKPLCIFPAGSNVIPPFAPQGGPLLSFTEPTSAAEWCPGREERLERNWLT